MITINIRSNIDVLRAAFEAKKRSIDRAIQAGMSASKPAVKTVLRDELRKAFNVKQERFLRTWTVSARSVPLTLVIENKAKGFGLHATGGSIGVRGGTVLLIPINTAAGTRIGTVKFYRMIQWLHQEKLTVIKNGVLYVRPPMNTSRRGGVQVGTRIQKRFRQRFSGSFKRPTGFDIKLNDNGLTPIAIVRRSITMRKRFDMTGIVQRRLIPIIVQSIRAEANR